MSKQNGPEPELAPITEINEALAEAFGKAKEIYDAKLAELEEAQKRVITLKAEIQPLTAILRQAGLVEKRPWGKHRETEGKAKVGGKGMGEERLERFKSYFVRYGEEYPPALEGVPGSFTAPLVADTYRLEKSAVNKAVQIMREDGRLRAAGKIRRADGIGAATTVYVFDR